MIAGGESRPAGRGWACLALAALLCTSSAAGAAEPLTDWHPLKDRPQAFAGRAVRLGQAYCGSGGQNAKEPGLYQCAVGPGAVYVESRTVVMSRAARARMAGCGGLDVWERSSWCRSTVAFTVGRHRQAPDIDTKMRPLLFTADALTIE